MASVLWNLLRFTGLAIGVPTSQPHLLNIYGRAIKPQDIRVNGGGFTVTADEINVTVTRGVLSNADVDVEVEARHSIIDAEPFGGVATSLLPFVIEGAGGGGDGGVGISAGTQLASTGTVSFADSNGISFGLSNSSILTASFAAIKSLSGGTTNATGPGVSFANSNGVTFGVAGNTVTASVASAAPETPFAISAGTQSVSTGTVSFANSNGVTFGMSGSNTITASIAAQTDVTFVQFAPEVGIPQQPIGSNGLLYIQPRSLPYLSFSQHNALINFSGETNSTGTISFTHALGVYTKNVSTLSLLMSTSFSSTINHSGTASSDNNNGFRIITSPWTSSLSKGEYWIGVAMSSTFSSQDATAQLVFMSTNSVFSGYLGSAFNSSHTTNMVLGLGNFSASTAQMPSSIAFSNIRGSVGARCPWFAFGVTV